MDDALTNLNWLTANQPGACIVSPPMLPSPTPPSVVPRILSPDSDADDTTAACQKPVVVEQEKPQVDYSRVPLKPPHSYSQLISMALMAFDGRKVLLGEIYDWVRTSFAFFRGPDTSWQNSIRHNLSLNKQFLKVARDPDDKGKGSYWMLDPSNAQSKDPYCIRRRTFPPDNKVSRPKLPEALHPCVNPIVQSFVNGEKTVEELQAALQKVKALKSSENTSKTTSKVLKRSKSECEKNKSTTTRSSKRLRKAVSESAEYGLEVVEATAVEVGAEEIVYATAIPSIDHLNEKFFRRQSAAALDAYNPQLKSGDRLRLDYNWDGYASSTPVAANNLHLPLQVETFDSVVLSPSTCSNESENSRIPTPEWWKQSGIGGGVGYLRPESLLSPGNSLSAYTLTRVLIDSLITSPCSGGQQSLVSPSIPHPWSEPSRNFVEAISQNPPPGIFSEADATAGLLDIVGSYGRTVICDVNVL